MNNPFINLFFGDTAVRREQQLKREAEHRIQLREYDGKLYVALGGLPLFKTDDFNKNPIEVLKEARETYKNFILCQD